MIHSEIDGELVRTRFDGTSVDLVLEAGCVLGRMAEALAREHKTLGMEEFTAEYVLQLVLDEARGRLKGEPVAVEKRRKLQDGAPDPEDPEDPPEKPEPRKRRRRQRAAEAVDIEDEGPRTIVINL